MPASGFGGRVFRFLESVVEMNTTQHADQSFSDRLFVPKTFVFDASLEHPCRLIFPIAPGLFSQALCLLLLCQFH